MTIATTRHDVKVTVSDPAGRVATTSLPGVTVFELARLSLPAGTRTTADSLADARCGSCNYCSAVAD